MDRSQKLISRLYSIRNQYGKEIAGQKLNLLAAIGSEKLKTKKALQSWHEILLFLTAYPDNSSVYQGSLKALQDLHSYIQSHESIEARLFNSGITNTRLCAAFGFEIVKWIRKKYPNDISLNSIEADDGQIQSILSVVMPKVESEILQDGNADWNSWLQGSLENGEDILDKLIAIFDQSDIRPEVKDELWQAIGVNVEIGFPKHLCLPRSLFTPYYHRSLIKKKSALKSMGIKATRIILNEDEAEQVIECGRMVLVRHLREIDPISFTSAPLVSYYKLYRGLSIALMGMVPERRHPIDSYMGYVVFKNGLPVAYAGSWILFDSGRIGLNIFPAYRGGESHYIFEQILRLHAKVYHLNRFTVDPYQIGKDNTDGIKSGAFWTYYHAGFRPVREEQKEISAAETLTMKLKRGYRTPPPVLEELARSRMEILLQKKTVRFDATDLSRVYLRILKDNYNNDRKLAEDLLFPKLAKLLQIKNYQQEEMKFVLKNWCILLLSHEQELRANRRFKTMLKDLFECKATGSEEEYIKGLQQATELKKLMEGLVKQF